jgi:hypothetical protein
MKPHTPRTTTPPVSQRFGRKLTQMALAAAALAACQAAQAANHALIMWVGTYSRADANLPGIDLDAENAKKIALAMGVPPSNIKEIKNQELTANRVMQALEEINRTIATNDKVFLYYSGHGAQIEGSGGSKCTEGMVTHEVALFDDARMQQALTALGAKASQVVMMNDSCFSGGAATKSAPRSVDGEVAKFYSGKLSAGATVSDEHVCGNAVNKMSRNLQAVSNNMPRPPQVLYVAASAADEVSYATKQGSVATLAWASCLGSDANRSGSINGEELRDCAQKFINRRGGRGQTITLVGNTSLPLMFTDAAASSRVDAVAALDDIRAMRDPSISLSLSPAKRTMRINQDFLDFSVSTSAQGYLYILHVGSDGKTFDLLFPNKEDSNNYITAGTQNFPRSNWRVRAAGPAGKNHLLAVLTDKPKDLTKGMDMASLFPSAQATMANAKTLRAEASGSGRFGASDVVPIEEAN